MRDKERAREQIAALVNRYKGLSATERRDYSEEEVKQGFLLPLFRILGWDVENRHEVRAEAPSGRGLADYLFVIDGVTVFPLEAKNFRADLDDTALVKQTISYAWNKNVPWAVLSNFDRLIILVADPQITPVYQTRLRLLRCAEYAGEDFDDLWLLSRPAMAQRQLERLAEREGRLAPRAGVSDALFADLTRWRRLLFAEITQMRVTLWSQDQNMVDEVISRFLDRLIFIRTLEDRGIEEDRLLSTLRQRAERKQRKRPLFDELLALFREMDRLYNSRLFAEHALDTPGSLHNDVLLGEIVEGLWKARGREARYDFATIDADVLGAVYEQYLAFRTLDPGGERDLEDSRGRRKSLGIYYTPVYVVRHILRQTLGRLLAEPGMTPERAHNLRILDPACGSGSFLIEAFRMLDAWLAQHGDEEDRAYPQVRRQRILLRNLYGVDVDPQAVEVARLNLLLRAAWQRGQLPMLHNIRHGNSLIDDEALAGTAAFNWHEQFPRVMEAGGFDVVIGNPPYGARLRAEERTWLRARYPAGNSNTAALFMLLAKIWGGYSGLIVPRAFSYVASWAKTRQSLLPELVELVDVGRAWRDVNLEQVIVIQQRATATPAWRALRRENDRFEFVTDIAKVDAERLGILPAPASAPEMALGRKLAAHRRLGAFTTNRRGAGLQRKAHAKAKGCRVVGGRQIQPWLINDDPLYLPPDASIPANARVHADCLLAQNILTFSANPVSHVRITATLAPDHPGFVILDTVNQLRLKSDCPFSARFLLSLLQSSLLRWYAWRFIYGGGTMTLHFDTPASAPLPIPRLDFSKPADKARHDALDASADRMLALHAELARSEDLFDDRRHELQRRIDELDARIDAQVYALYDLNDDDISLVEGRAD